MTWVKLDDRFPDHPKVHPLPLRAKWLYVQGLCYAASHLTDGLVPLSVVKGWTSVSTAQELVGAGLWDPATAGYLIHDYLSYNPSRDEADSKSQSARHASRIRWASDSDTERTRGREGDKTSKEHPLFGEFYDDYPRKVGRIAASAAFDKAVARGVEPELIVAGAARYRDDPDRTPKFTAHPATWLNQGRWLDESAAPTLHAVTDPSRIVGTPEYEAAQQAEWRRLEAAE